MNDLWTYIFVSAVTIWLLQRWRDRRHILLFRKFTTNWWHVISGFGCIMTSRGAIKLTSDILNKYGKTLVCYAGPFPIILTSDPELIKDVFNSKQGTTKPANLYSRLAIAFGRGLITLNDPLWSDERKLVNIAFNNKNLMSYIPIFNEEIDNELRSIDENIAAKSGKSMVVHFREFTIRIATRTTIGRFIDKTQFSGKYFAECASEFMLYAAELMINFLYFIPLINIIARMTYLKKAAAMMDGMKNLIRETMLEYPTKRGVDPSYETNINTAIQYMTSAAEEDKIKSEHVVNNMVHIFIGAFETTSTSLYYMLLMLGMHPEYQQRAYEEVCTIFPNNDEGFFDVTYEHIVQMDYIDRIMKETMRVLPIIPHAAREVSGHDLILSNGAVLPKGQCVIIDIFHLHHNKEIWGPDADQFNPDNFLPANIASKHLYSYIPFTKGMRFCIGLRYAELSIKVALVKLVKRYKFTANCKLEDLSFENHVTLKLSKEPPLLVERR